MTPSIPHSSHAQFEHCVSIIRQASVEILLLLKVHVAEAKDPRWFLEQLDNARLGLGGWGMVAKRLNLNDAEMSQFTLQLRLLQQRVPQYESGQDVSDNQLIAAMRFVAILEHLRQKQPLLTYSTELISGKDAPQEQAQKQVRALELMIKSLILHAWPDPGKFNNHLKTLFSADRVRRWLKLGERNDILSGMLFSELSLMLVDKKEFTRHYSTMFNDASMLTLFVEQRKTLQTFLDDIRKIRNCIIAGQPLTSVQNMLLEHYYEQISGPVQKAFYAGRTRVNPADIFAVDSSELQSFWEHAREKDHETGGDLFEVRDNIDAPGRHAERSPEERDQLIAGVLWGAVAVMVAVILTGGLWLYFSNDAQTTAMAQTQQEMEKERAREKSQPRATLMQMGITWDENSFRSAIDRNDARVVQLFLEGDMEWQLAWTELALSARNNDVLELLLRYRLQMTEVQPCRRFINTLSHAMLAGDSLTSMRKQFLQDFCAAPEVVEHQRYEMEQAKLRAQAEPDDNTDEWQSIQTAIYNVIH